MFKKLWKYILKPKTWVAEIFIIAIAAAFLIIGYFGYWQSIKNLLDSDFLSFSIGSNRYSLFTILKSILIIFILFWLAGIVADFAESKIKKIKGVNTSNRSLIIKAIQIFGYLIAFLLGLDLLGLDFKSLAIFSGAIGIGIGFGLQKITSNFISGLILLFEKSAEKNDLIELADGTQGFIKQTYARYTLLEAFDGREIIIPNEDFIINRVTNWTLSNKKGRISFDVPIAYKSDLEKAIKILLNSANNHPKCLGTPKPECFVKAFSAGLVHLSLVFWVVDVTEGRSLPQSDVMRTIIKEFKKQGIAML